MSLQYQENILDSHIFGLKVAELMLFKLSNSSDIISCNNNIDHTINALAKRCDNKIKTLNDLSHSFSIKKSA